MEKLQSILKRLEEIESLEEQEPLDQLGSYIVGTLIIDEGATKLYETEPLLEEIAELGSDLEASKDQAALAENLWREIKILITKVKKKYQ